MNHNFRNALAFTLKWEGGLEGKSDDPTDRGGRTKAGITQIAFDSWLRSMNATPGRDVWTITPDEISAIYEERYWLPCRCDQLPDKLDLCMFDAAVNHGVRKAVQFLQRSAGVVDDGDFGPPDDAGGRSRQLSRPDAVPAHWLLYGAGEILFGHRT